MFNGLTHSMGIACMSWGIIVDRGLATAGPGQLVQGLQCCRTDRLMVTRGSTTGFTNTFDLRTINHLLNLTH